MTGFQVTADHLGAMHAYLVEINSQLVEIDAYVSTHVATTEPYGDGLFKPIGGYIRDGAYQPFSDALDKAGASLIASRGELVAAGKEYDMVDGHLSTYYRQESDPRAAYSPAPDVGPRTMQYRSAPAITYSHLHEMSEVLTTPVEGDIELDIDKNDAKFNTLNEGISAATGFYTECQGLVAKVGLPFPGPEIQQTNAVELFVKPFSGDWNQIIACGDAIDKAGNGLTKVGLNLGLALAQQEISADWEGQAATSFALHIAGHAAIYGAAGFVVAQGKLVFDGLSETAQIIGGLIVELIDTALDIAVWLARKIARYGRAWIGWATFAADILVDGWDAIQSIIDMMFALKDTIVAVFDMHDAVTDWVETIPATLEVFKGLREEMEKIPDIVETPVLTTAQLIKGVSDTGQEAQQVLDDRRQAEEDIAEAEENLEQLGDDVEEPEAPESLTEVEVPEVAIPEDEET